MQLWPFQGNSGSRVVREAASRTVFVFYSVYIFIKVPVIYKLFNYIPTSQIYVQLDPQLIIFFPLISKAQNLSFHVCLACIRVSSNKIHILNIDFFNEYSYLLFLIFYYGPFFTLSCILCIQNKIRLGYSSSHKLKRLIFLKLK